MQKKVCTLHNTQQIKIVKDKATLPPCGYPNCMAIQDCTRLGIKRGSMACRSMAYTLNSYGI
jgi:hypothetical protein